MSDIVLSVFASLTSQLDTVVHCPWAPSAFRWQQLQVPLTVLCGLCGDDRKPQRGEYVGSVNVGTNNSWGEVAKPSIAFSRSDYWQCLSTCKPRSTLSNSCFTLHSSDELAAHYSIWRLFKHPGLPGRVTMWFKSMGKPSKITKHDKLQVDPGNIPPRHWLSLIRMHAPKNTSFNFPFWLVRGWHWQPAYLGSQENKLLERHRKLCL